MQEVLDLEMEDHANGRNLRCLEQKMENTLGSEPIGSAILFFYQLIWAEKAADHQIYLLTYAYKPPAAPATKLTNVRKI